MSRPKIDFRTSSKECYQRFCDSNPNIELSFEDYKKIIYTYNSNLINYMLETGENIKMPWGLGELVVNKYKPRRFRTNPEGVVKPNLPVDWIETKKQGKYIYILNSHTDGWKYYWMWNWWKSKLHHAYMWKFVMARCNSRLLNTYLRKPNGKYKDLYKEYPRTK